MKKMIFDSMVKNAVKWVLPFCLFAFLPLTVYFSPSLAFTWAVTSVERVVLI